MPDAGRNLESTDQGHWAECARMGAEEWVGASEWPAGGDSSFWDALLVYGGEEGEYLVWHYLIVRDFLGDKSCVLARMAINRRSMYESCSVLPSVNWPLRNLRYRDKLILAI